MVTCESFRLWYIELEGVCADWLERKRLDQGDTLYVEEVMVKLI